MTTCAPGAIITQKMKMPPNLDPTLYIVKPRNNTSGQSEGLLGSCRSRRMDSGKFMLPFQGVQLQSSKPLRSCSSAWWSSEPGFEESRHICRPSPGADTCSWDASRACLENGEGNGSKDCQHSGLLISCRLNSIQQLSERKEACQQHCHRIPSVN